MNSGEGDRAQPRPGPPIRTPSDHSPSAGSPRLIAGHHVLHRPLMPRHPPNAHKNKQNTSAPAHGGHATKIKDARVHYAVHNQPAHQPRPHHPRQQASRTRKEAPGRTAPDPDSVPPHHPPTHPHHPTGQHGRATSSRQPHPSTQAPRHNDRTPTSRTRPVPYTTALHQPGPPTSRPATLPAPGTSQHSRPNKRAP